MKTRKADTPAKKTPPARKSATKTPPTPSVTSQQSPSDSTVTPKRTPSTRGKTVTTDDATVATPEIPVLEVKKEDGTAKATPGVKSGNKKTIKRVVKRTVVKKKPKLGGATKPPPASVSVKEDDSEVPAEEESLEEVKEVVHVKQEGSSPNDVGTALKDDKDDMELEAEDNVEGVENSTDVKSSVENVEGNLRPESSDVTDVAMSLKHQVPEVSEKETMETEKEFFEIEEPDEEGFEIEEPGTEVEHEERNVEKLIEDQETTLHKEMDVKIEGVPAEVNEDELENKVPVDMQKSVNEEFLEEDSQERLCLSDEEKDKDIGNEGHEEDEEEDEDELPDVKVTEHGELGFREHEEFTEAAEERKRRKEFEIFVGGLSRDATEEDVKKVFKNAGEVVDVRMYKELPSNKNRGYAFVRFASKEHVTRALAEMKNPVIRGKRCGTAPSEDNDTLFVGNICNSWTKEAIRRKLKDYGIDGVERITLVPDPQHEGLSRGFAFIEFSGHPDAMLAYKRLQKSDAILGHRDRTAKVAFAEPLQEPDPEVLAQVKSVFVDGLPAHWDEDTVRDHLKVYGTIERVMLARNMSAAKRKDFGFVDFTTHEAALACIDGISNAKLGDDKITVRARLSNPLPKAQAVKGEIAGGFRIGHRSRATYPRAGRGFERGGLSSDRRASEQGRGFYQHRPGQTRGMGFAEDYLPVGPHPPFRGRHSFGGRWDDFRGPHRPSDHGPVPPRYDGDRLRHGADMYRDHPIPMRGRPYMPEERFSRPYGGRPYEDPYTYGDTSRGTKRPYFAERDTDYTEPSRGRPRLDYSDPAFSAPGSRYRGDGIGGPPRDYYNYDYSSYYAGERPYATGDRPYAGGRPYAGDQPYGGRYPY